MLLTMCLVIMFAATTIPMISHLYGFSHAVADYVSSLAPFESGNSSPISVCAGCINIG